VVSCALTTLKLVVVVIVSRVIDSVATIATAASIDFIVISAEEQIVRYITYQSQGPATLRVLLLL
jgi:hypothetical protein